jgi:hypothetical protein
VCSHARTLRAGGPRGWLAPPPHRGRVKHILEGWNRASVQPQHPYPRSSCPQEWLGKAGQLAQQCWFWLSKCASNRAGGAPTAALEGGEGGPKEHISRANRRPASRPTHSHNPFRGAQEFSEAGQLATAVAFLVASKVNSTEPGVLPPPALAAWRDVPKPNISQGQEQRIGPQPHSLLPFRSEVPPECSEPGQPAQQ